MATKQVQIPSKFSVLGKDGTISQPWAYFFNNVTSQLPPPGAGYVVDGSAATTGTTTLYQGPAGSKSGSPHNNDIYFADDTGQIFTASGGAWHLQSSALTGDVLKNAFTNVTTLLDVNAAPGTYGSGNLVPIITVDSKGRVTNVNFAPTEMPPLPGGSGDFIFTDGLGTANASSFFNTSTYTTTYKIKFHQSDATPILALAVPGNTLVTKVEFCVLTAFDGSPSVSVGTASSYNDLMSSTDNNPTVLSNWTVEPSMDYTGATQIYISVAAGGGTTGYGLVIVTTVQL